MDEAKSARRWRVAGMGYVLDLTDLGTSFEVDHLRRSSGELHGDVVVRTRWPGARTVSGVLHASRFNLTAPTTRRTVARMLDERVPTDHATDKLDWAGYLEEFCQRVLVAERAGTPFVDVGRRELPPDAGVLVDPLLPAGKATILFGDGGTGKSYLAVGLAVSVVTGTSMLPGFAIRDSGPVIYLDWETDEYDIERRVRAVCAGGYIEPVMLRYRSCARTLADMVEEVSREVSRVSARLVVIDSVGLAAGTSNENGDAADSALRFFAAARHLGTTVLAVDHVTKAPSEGGAAKPYGSTYKSNLARATWELRQAPGGAIALYHRKANTSARHDAIGLRANFDAGRVWWTAEAITDDSLTKPLGIVERAALLLSEHPRSTKELSTELGRSEGSVRTMLARDVRFRNTPSGWRLIEGGAA